MSVVGDIAQSLIEPMAGLLSEFITDKDQRYAIASKMASQAATEAHVAQMGQIEVNKIEAASEKWWKAGWRPFIGWTCGSAMAFNYILAPIAGIWVELPVLDITTMFPVLLGLLGLGAMRTQEKVKMLKR